MARVEIHPDAEYVGKLCQCSCVCELEIVITTGSEKDVCKFCQAGKHHIYATPSTTGDEG